MKKMKHTVRTILFIILGCLMAGGLQAQDGKYFTGDPEQFPARLTELFSNISSPSVGLKVRELLNPFLEDWNTGYYTKIEKELVISNANTLLAKRLSNYPDIFNYLSVVHGLQKRGNKEAVSVWLQELALKAPDRTLRQNQVWINQYLSFVSEKRLFESLSFNWYVSDTALNLGYDTAIFVTYKKTDLICASKKDTSVIRATSGIYYPEIQQWKGQKGKVTWERVGLSRDSVYADLSSYQVNLKFSEYHADSVRLINKKFFREPIFGELNEKVLSTPPGPNSTFPQFISYLKNYEIRNLFPNIDYFGGFSVEGARVVGSGEVNQNAYLTISRDGRLLAQIRSNAFRIQGDQITASPAALSIITNGDSIYHPGLQLKYFHDKRQMVMLRPESGISQSPFFNAYHAIDMDCGAIYWNLDQDSIHFESVPGVNRQSTNEFISDNFFSKYEFYKIQGIDEVNPLYIIREYSRKFGTTEVTPNLLAQFMNKSPDQIKAMLLKLSIQGFLYYDLVNDNAIIQDRLNQYIEANAGVRDYDVIKIRSEVNSVSNATLNLKNYDLTVRGVDQVFLSDSQQVYIYPANKEIILKSGLDFMFTGVVKAGLFDFHAHECSFEYDSFRLNLPTIDSLVFKVRSFVPDSKGQRQLVKVGSVIEDLSGQILIDHPTNKSGIKSFPEFPVFISEQESFVYYDHDTLYNRDRFAYHIYPFVIDSLDNFSTDNLVFDGYLVSDSIFPNILQALKVQPDYSLGFVNEAPAGGYPLYGGAGDYFEKVNLSNRGLRGDGRMTFLTSETVSVDFLFYPDTLIAELARSFTIAPQMLKVEYPDVAADSVNAVWHPYIDTLRVRTLEKPARLYAGSALFNGDLFYSSTGLSGTGKTAFEQVELLSESYRFIHHTIQADTLDFSLFSKETRDLVVSAEKYRATVDFDLRTVEFKTNEKGSTVSFPYNNFVCYMDNIDWYMDKGEMQLFNDLGQQFEGIDTMSRKQLLKLDLSGSDFLATNPAMDSLSFFSVTARYDLNSYVVDAGDVKLIRVADAAIYPDSGYVKILQGGRIQTLRNASVLADTAAGNHLIEAATVDILSRRNFEGKGTYQYRSLDQPLQEFFLDSLWVENGKTLGRGVIPAANEFTLNPYFDYQGKANFLSDRSDLYFEGGFRSKDDCFSPEKKYWAAFSAWIDPADVKIPVQEPLYDLEGKALDLGIYISDYEEEIYGSWFAPRFLAWDTAMITGSGQVWYDRTQNAYRVTADSTAPASGAAPELIFDTRKCAMESSGPLNLGLYFNYVDLKSHGRVRQLLIPDSTEIGVSMSFDFLFSEPALNVMADSIILADLRGLDVGARAYQEFLDYSMGTDRAGELKSDISLYGNFRRMPEELIHSLVLTDVKLYWNDQTNSYVSKGAIGVLGIGKNAVNRYVNGNLELIRRRSGDALTLYLELNPQQWYFFDYRSGIMQALSTDMAFNERIESVKQEKRMQSKPGLDETYEYVTSSRRKLIEFLRRMESVE